jgi:hypothetical protein
MDEPVIMGGNFYTPERRRPEQYGYDALSYAVIVSFILFIFGCWWSLPCTIIGIILAITVSIVVSSNTGRE